MAPLIGLRLARLVGRLMVGAPEGWAEGKLEQASIGRTGRPQIAPAVRTFFDILNAFWGVIACLGLLVWMGIGYWSGLESEPGRLLAALIEGIPLALTFYYGAVCRIRPRTIFATSGDVALIALWIATSAVLFAFVSA